MSSDSPSTVSSKAMFWAGWVMTVLAAAGLAMSGIMKFNLPPDAKEGLEKVGWKEEQVSNLAIVELSCAAIYLCPPTSVLGAILVTGYLGGAVATHVRVHEGFRPTNHTRRHRLGWNLFARPAVTGIGAMEDIVAIRSNVES